jgi:polyhydroxybutyrate depolymerase
MTGGALGSTGGIKATGGTSAGASSFGGSPSFGGSTTAGTGGAVSVGGAATMGGAAVGGKSGAGGKSGGAGAPSGGATGNGGSSAVGGSSSGSGGAKATMGCGSAKAPMSGRFDIDVEGKTREYILAVPDDYDANKPYRLIFGWHPLGGSAEQVAKGGYYGLEREAKGDAIFVSAEGLPFQGNSLGWANSKGEDLRFLDAMMERFRSELCIDENRIFSTGFSFGGMMSWAVGCGSGIMRAIAPQAGNIQVSGCEDGTQSVAVMGFHGVNDTVVDIDGGRDGRDVFVERNGCMEATMAVTPSWCDGLQASNQPCSCVSYQGCKAGYPVIWCEFNGPHTPAPNSGATIWNFFSQF